jgi:hypothetical protein
MIDAVGGAPDARQVLCGKVDAPPVGVEDVVAGGVGAELGEDGAAAGLVRLPDHAALVNLSRIGRLAAGTKVLTEHHRIAGAVTRRRNKMPQDGVAWGT